MGAARASNSREGVFPSAAAAETTSCELGRVLRPLWLLAFLAALGTVVSGTVLALRDTYEVRPAFTALGLDYDVQDNGEITVQVDPSPGSAVKKDTDYRIIAINQKPVALDIHSPDLAR